MPNNKPGEDLRAAAEAYTRATGGTAQRKEDSEGTLAKTVGGQAGASASEASE